MMDSECCKVAWATFFVPRPDLQALRISTDLKSAKDGGLVIFQLRFDLSSSAKLHNR